MGKVVDGEIVLTEEEASRLLGIRLKERRRATTKEDKELIFIAKSMR
jgi:hypothetical protein